MPNGSRRARKDKDAADLVRKLMVERGHSAYSLSAAILAKGTKAGYPPHRVKVSPDSLYLLLSKHFEPGPRIKWAIAFYFDRVPGQIWARDALPVSTEVAVAA